MFRIATVILMSAFPLFGSKDESTIVSVVQRLFDAMQAKDAVAIRGLTLPETQLVALRPDGKATVTAVAKFAETIAAAEDTLVEKMWEPKVTLQGKIATLWAPYNFHRSGTLTHCGIDTVSLVMVGNEWKIAGITYTVEQTGCGSK